MSKNTYLYLAVPAKNRTCFKRGGRRAGPTRLRTAAAHRYANSSCSLASTCHARYECEEQARCDAFAPNISPLEDKNDSPVRGQNPNPSLPRARTRAHATTLNAVLALVKLFPFGAGARCKHISPRCCSPHRTCMHCLQGLLLSALAQTTYNVLCSLISLIRCTAVVVRWGGLHRLSLFPFPASGEFAP